jgi:hypothetical protein
MSTVTRAQPGTAVPAWLLGHGAKRLGLGAEAHEAASPGLVS